MSLRGRLLAAFAYVLVLTIVALEVPLALNVSRRVDAEVKSEAASGAQVVASSAAGSLGRSAELQRLARASAADLGGRVIIVDRRGRLVADSAGEGLRAASYGGRPEIATALRGRISQGKRHSQSLDQDLLYTAVPILRAGRPSGAVRVTQSFAEVQSEMRADALALIAIGAGVLVLGLALAWFLAGSIARPLRGLANAARGLAAGDLTERAPEGGSREQREVAVAFNDMAAQVEHALNSQRDFVANASHQLRTPLTGLRLRLESAALKSTDAQVRGDLEAAEQEAERLARLLKGLLALARERATPPAIAPVSLARHVEAAAERWVGPAQRGGGEFVVAGEGDVMVRISDDDLAVILDNLIENALEHGGRATTITVSWTSTARIAQLVVSDDGPGIPPGQEERVFERFHRAASADVPGTGLGLPIVRTLAERWGGGATIGNGPTGGALAEVLLPAVPADLPDLDLQFDDALPTRG